MAGEHLPTNKLSPDKPAHKHTHTDTQTHTQTQAASTCQEPSQGAHHIAHHIPSRLNKNEHGQWQCQEQNKITLAWTGSGRSGEERKGEVAGRKTHQQGLRRKKASQKNNMLNKQHCLVLQGARCRMAKQSKQGRLRPRNNGVTVSEESKSGLAP